MKKPSIKEKKFVDNLLLLGNRVEAYYTAYSKNTKRSGASANAQKILDRPHVAAYLAERMKQLDDQMIMKQSEVLKRLTAIARREEAEVIVVTTSEEYAEWIDGRKNVEKKETPQRVEIPAKLADVNKALELLGKYYSMFTDRQDISGDVNLRIEVDYGEDDPDSE